MKYSLDASLQEIQKRRDECLKAKRRRSIRALSGSTVLTAALMIAVIRQFSGARAARAAGSVYGAFLLSPAVGGYILAGVIAFAAGIAFTVLCLSRREKEREKQKQKSSEKDSKQL